MRGDLGKLYMCSLPLVASGRVKPSPAFSFSLGHKLLSCHHSCRLGALEPNFCSRLPGETGLQLGPAPPSTWLHPSRLSPIPCVRPQLASSASSNEPNSKPQSHALADPGVAREVGKSFLFPT